MPAALAEAQQRGYAEADPTGDVEYSMPPESGDLGQPADGGGFIHGRRGSHWHHPAHP